MVIARLMMMMMVMMMPANCYGYSTSYDDGDDDASKLLWLLHV